MISIPQSHASVIYQIRCIPNGKVYVGSALDITARAKAHRNALRRGDHHSSHLQRAWGKYGETAFVLEVLEVVMFPEHLFAREQVWLERKRATERRHGFNVQPMAGSFVGTPITPEAHAKRKAAQGTTEARSRKSAAAKAMWADPEHRAKVSAAIKAAHATPEGRAKLKARAHRKVRLKTPKVHAPVSDRMKAQWQDSNYRTHISSGIKSRMGGQWQDPEWSAQQRAILQDPGHRARQSERMKASWARRKAELNQDE